MADEKTVSSISYDDINKKLIFTFNDNTTVESYILNVDKGNLDCTVEQLKDKLDTIQIIDAHTTQKIGTEYYLTQIQIGENLYRIQSPLLFSSDQIAALRLLTEAKIVQYDGYINTKQDALSQAQITAINAISQ